MEYIKNEINKLDIEKEFKNILKLNTSEKFSIEWGMDYIFFSPSKRLRPLLLLESNLCYNDLDTDSYILACVVELIHTYSLVHDDLPCMDNDDLRRGLKTLHIIKSEAYAVLVGDALLTYSYGILSNYSKKELLPKILQLINKKAGFLGMIRGQLLDLQGENKKLSIKEIDEINNKKTGAMFELSLMLGALNGFADINDFNNFEQLGSLIGYIFQLKDDVLDIIGDEKKLGKKVGSDEKNNKSSIPLITGLDKSLKMLNEYGKKALEYVDGFSKNKEFFNKLINFMITREK